MMPHSDFYNFIYELENIFINLFPFVSVENSVGSKLGLHFTNVPFNHPCELFDKSFLLNSYIKFRSLVSEKKIKNRKLTVLSHL